MCLVSAGRAGASNCGAAAAACRRPGRWRYLMRRVMSLWLPSWAIDRQFRQSRRPAPDEAFALVASSGNRRLVMAASAAAQGLGIAPGMTLADARALHPALTVAAADPSGDAAALVQLVAACSRYSPWTAAHVADGV